MNNKIAMLFSGFTRSVPHLIKNLKTLNPELLDPSVTDIFVHTWSGINRSNWSLYPNPNWKYTNGLSPAIEAKLFSLDYMKKHMNVVASIQEDEKTLDHVKLFSSNPYVFGFASMAKSQQRVANLFEDYCNNNKAQYDLVIRTRTDIRYQIPFPIEEFISCIRKTGCSVFFPNRHSFGGVTDMLCVGDSKTTIQVCNLYSYLEKNCDMFMNTFIDRLPGSEIWLLKYLEEQGIQYGLFDVEHGLSRLVEINDDLSKKIPEGGIDGTTIEQFDGVSYVNFIM